MRGNFDRRIESGPSMLHRVTALIIVAILPTIAAAEPPATRPDGAQVQKWLDRAEHELAPMPADAPREGLLPAPEELATVIYHLSPSGDRRMLAERFVNAGLKSDLAKEQSAEQVSGAYLGAALEFAMLDDPPAARRMLAAADKPTGLPPTTNPVTQFMASQSNWITGQIELLLHDTAAFDKLNLTAEDAGMTADLLRYFGFDSPADYAATRRKKLLKDEAAKTGKPVPGPGTADIRECIQRDDLAGAARMAKQVAENENGYTARSAYFLVAQGCVDDGDLPGYYQARDAILAIDGKTNPSVDYELPPLLHLCTRVNDQAGFTQVADLWKSQFQHEATGRADSQLDYSRNRARLATEYAAMNDIADYQSAVSEAQKILDAIQIRPGSRHASEINGDRASAYLLIAAARARAGDVSGVASDKSASLKSATLDSPDWELAYGAVAERFADAGLFDDALAALADAGPDKYGITLRYITHRMLRAGKIDKAWQAVAAVPGPRNAGGVCDAIVQETLAGRSAELAGRIDALPSPLERATADFEVAATLSGRPYQGLLGIFKASED
jgi:hypothetical protein